jgi:hypothetical protein
LTRKTKKFLEGNKTKDDVIENLFAQVLYQKFIFNLMGRLHTNLTNVKSCSALTLTCPRIVLIGLKRISRET